jgi:hypothetical protein
LDNFEVGVWASTCNKHTQTLVNTCFSPSNVGRLKFVWSQEECEVTRAPDGKPIYHKALHKVWEAGYGVPPKITITLEAEAHNAQNDPPAAIKLVMSPFDSQYKQHRERLKLDGALVEELRQLAQGEWEWAAAAFVAHAAAIDNSR